MDKLAPQALLAGFFFALQLAPSVVILVTNGKRACHQNQHCQ